ncbi:unnamed protein product [marine sediment metagenome]|uniref:Uncharacterized protein n=1 Tax=marine sediment metagenome TaxID=412755 RepID=X1D116_9ZZZZ
MASYDWILALGIILGLSFGVTVFTKKNFMTFLAWFNIFTAFMVWSNLLEMWVLTLSITLLVISSFVDYKNNRGDNN